MAVARANITSAFKTKLDIARASGRKGAQKATEAGAKHLIEKTADFYENAYPAEKEIQTLVKGRITEGGAVGVTVGDTEDNRFIEDSYTPLHQIIRDCKVITITDETSLSAGASPGLFAAKAITITGGDVVSSQACNTDEINAKAKFKYQRKNGGTFEANPFHGKYIESVDRGEPGVWEVEPRSDNPRNTLFPQIGFPARKMLKSVEPVRGFEVARTTERAAVVNMARAIIKEFIGFVAGRGFSPFAQGPSGSTLGVAQSDTLTDIS